MSIGHKIKTLRRAKELTQEELAEVLMNLRDKKYALFSLLFEKGDYGFLRSIWRFHTRCRPENMPSGKTRKNACPIVQALMTIKKIRQPTF